MLEMHHIAKVYRTETVETAALRDFNLHVTPGEFVAVTGASGSGKSTFLGIAGLIEAPSGGRYVLDGVDVSQMNDRQRSRLRNQKIGFVFQAFNLIPDLNLRDNIEVPLGYRGLRAAERRELAQAALAKVGLAGRARHYPGQLSGGQQQRVAIARALAGNPPLLLADEPTGNLDTQMAAGVIDLLQELHAGGATIVMVTHDLHLAERAQRIVKVMDGQAAEVARDARLHSVSGSAA
ncbi:putative ABC transport system ATP-binding protein [Duganella sacchari]|uniref:Putative ABC transport system ATP-binding protein n=1 Tax=Duganella sacchari TaxID=551987 RepID=A0A1M7MVA1_9BURK|nr:ABC transporter ATP-binding protein [Duganella sacchari]SHM94952.1 putative ABC transport system ATP-binding protein [Duganella sacchari]